MGIRFRDSHARSPTALTTGYEIFNENTSNVSCAWSSIDKETSRSQPAGLREYGAFGDGLIISGEDQLMWNVDYPYEDYNEIGRWFDHLEMSEQLRARLDRRMPKKCSGWLKSGHSSAFRSPLLQLNLIADLVSEQS